MKKKFWRVVAISLLLTGMLTAMEADWLPEPGISIKEMATYNC